MIYRDDDISVHTDAYMFKKIHQQFIDQNKTHTVAVVMKDLWENQAIFWYLATAPNLEIGLHGWEHKDYSLMSYDDCYFDLSRAMSYWEKNSDRMIGHHKEIKTFFAPWNKESDNIRKACEDLGLQFCNIKQGRWNGDRITSFHWWYAGMSDNWHLI